ncbi:hypothetical protein Moror_16158 [Moniliophthora roreri MCA 2997]|uniref:Uncharacterized protein n=2 Tax=Moniliophthora roreri TaxID=221103 RepID=V2YCL8_MONRO|nr:hypothetical protein Moror_16158 [Moniliophthora roreri MCA 2997]
MVIRLAKPAASNTKSEQGHASLLQVNVDTSDNLSPALTKAQEIRIIGTGNLRQLIDEGTKLAAFGGNVLALEFGLELITLGSRINITSLSGFHEMNTTENRWSVVDGLEHFIPIT